MKTGRKHFHPLVGCEVDALFHYRKTTCGYSRLLEVNDAQTKIKCKCSLTDELCKYTLPQNTTDCVVYKKFVRANEEVILKSNLQALVQYFHSGAHLAHRRNLRS